MATFDIKTMKGTNSSIKKYYIQVVDTLFAQLDKPKGLIDGF